jgi:hypothetical protein
MNCSSTSQRIPHQKLLNVNSGNDYHTAAFQGELQTTGVSNVNSDGYLPLDQGDLLLPCVGGDFAMGRSLIKGVLP